jgi:hypothetical protein
MTPRSERSAALKSSQALLYFRDLDLEKQLPEPAGAMLPVEAGATCA